MPVYVDDALIPARIENHGRVHDTWWSHLVATTPRELHDFATRTLGLQRGWFQDHWPFPHYDLTAPKRAQALASGAIAIEYGDPEALNHGRWLPPVLVTASRDGLTLEDVEAGLKPVFDPRRVLISGGARGGDRMAESVWQVWGGEIDRHRVSPEAWQRSRGAGYDRNDEMVGKTAKRGGECVALVAACTDTRCWRTDRHGTHGASHCADQAREAGLTVHAPDIGGERSAWRPSRHDWQRTGDPDRKACECGVTAVRTPAAGGWGWQVEFLVPGLPGTPEMPPHFTKGDVQRSRPAAPPRQPGPGQPPRAALPDADEDLTPVAGTDLRRGTYDETVQCGCGTEFLRSAGAAYGQCLGCEITARAVAAGPQAQAEIAAVATWNAGVLGRGPAAAPAPEPGGSDSERSGDREAAS